MDGAGPEQLSIAHAASEDPSQVVRTNEVCRGFLRGMCNRGNECRYSHDLNLARANPGPPQHTGPPRKELCMNFTRGMCHYGNACRYNRDVTSATMNAGPRSDEVCRNFLRGMCRWGDACKYSHSN